MLQIARFDCDCYVKSPPERVPGDKFSLAVENVVKFSEGLRVTNFKPFSLGNMKEICHQKSTEFFTLGGGGKNAKFSSPKASGNGFAQRLWFVIRIVNRKAQCTDLLYRKMHCDCRGDFNRGSNHKSRDLKVRFELFETATWGNFLWFGLRDLKSLAICDLWFGALSTAAIFSLLVNRPCRPRGRILALGARLRGRTATQRSKKGSEKALERVLGKVLRRVLRRGLLWDLQ